jgi:phenylalanyl-tRNA synthetase beta chain
MLTAQEELQVLAPTWRMDVTREVDLIEEVARLRGYDTFPNELRPYRLGNVPDDPLHLVARRLRSALAAAGLYEVRPMPFVAGTPDRYVRVSNPLAENEAYLRRELLESLARRAEYNLSQMQRNVRLFEIGAAFSPGAPGELPREEMRVAVLVMGDRRPAHFTEDKPPAYDLWDAKGLGELAASVAFPGAPVELRPVGDGEVLWHVAVSQRVLGRVSRVALDAPAWASPAYGVELSLATVDSSQVAPPGRSAMISAANLSAALDIGGLAGRARPEFRPLPAYPAAEEAIALVVPDRLAAVDVERVIRNSGGEILEQFTLVSEYRGPQIPAGHRSLAWRLTYRHPERTLSTKEVEGRKQRLLKTLETELGVRQRA